MRIAAIQFRPQHGNPISSRDRLQSMIRQAGEGGAKLVVCPEMAVTGYLWKSRDEITPFAEPRDGATYRMVAHEARRTGAWVVVGYAEMGEGGRFYNACMVVDPDGELRLNYRKAALFEADTTWASPGAGHAWIDTPLGRLAPGICMDLNDDDFVRHLRLQRVDVLAFCTNWLEQQHGVLGYWAQRLRPWQGLVVAANRWGVERGVAFRGESAIFRPLHVVYGRGRRRGDEVLLADVPEPKRG